MGTLEADLKAKAHDLGFDLVGVASAVEADGFARLRDWLDRGFAGSMDYMEKRAEARRHPESILPEVRSVIMVGMNYHASQSVSKRAAGNVARYARGEDYHHVLWGRLNALLAWLQQQRPGCTGRGVVDTAPLLERDFARRAGLGWFGKNTMLIDKRLGSWFFLGALLTDLELTPDPPHETSHCGTCTACLDACPTAAFAGPGWLDSRKCISYLTIELREEIPPELRKGVGDWLFGCDVCQEVCPWNRKAPVSHEPAWHGRPDLVSLDPVELLGLDDAAFRERFRGTALMRTKRRGLLRNAAIVLGNTGDVSALPALERVADDPEPVIAEAARWAIGQIRGRVMTELAELLQVALHDAKITDRQQAADRLARETSVEVLIPALQEALHHPEAIVRRRAAMLLGRLQLPSEQALTLLSEAMRDPSWPVREGAVHALSALLSNPAMTPRVHPLLVESTLHDPEPLVRSAASDALGRMGSEVEHVISDLLVALCHKHVKVRRRAIQALAKFPGHSACIVPILTSLLDDSHRKIRQTAAEALGAFGRDAVNSTDRLERRAHDGERAVAVAARTALANILRQEDGP